MCPTKMLLKSFVDSNSSSYSINSEVFPKFAKFMNPLGVIVPALISKKSLFCVIN